MRLETKHHFVPGQYVKLLGAAYGAGIGRVQQRVYDTMYLRVLMCNGQCIEGDDNNFVFADEREVAVAQMAHALGAMETGNGTT